MHPDRFSLTAALLRALALGSLVLGSLAVHAQSSTIVCTTGPDTHVYTVDESARTFVDRHGESYEVLQFDDIRIRARRESSDGTVRVVTLDRMTGGYADEWSFARRNRSVRHDGRCQRGSRQF